MLEYNSDSVEATKSLGLCIGSLLNGGEVIECIGDLGGGKTTLVSGIAEGFGSRDPVSSPSFTICNVYSRSDTKQIHHFDFYRLVEPGIMKDELFEVVGDLDSVTVVEWGDSVEDVLPESRIKVKLSAVSDSNRSIKIDTSDNEFINGLKRQLMELSV